jgi:hypothetical protein
MHQKPLCHAGFFNSRRTRVQRAAALTPTARAPRQARAERLTSARSSLRAPCRIRRFARCAVQIRPLCRSIPVLCDIASLIMARRAEWRRRQSRRPSPRRRRRRARPPRGRPRSGKRRSNAPRRRERLRPVEDFAKVGEAATRAPRGGRRHLRRFKSTTEGVGEIEAHASQVPLSNRLASRCHAFAARSAMRGSTRSGKEAGSPAQATRRSSVSCRLRSASPPLGSILDHLADALGNVHSQTADDRARAAIMFVARRS